MQLVACSRSSASERLMITSALLQLLSILMLKSRHGPQLNPLRFDFFLLNPFHCRTGAAAQLHTLVHQHIQRMPLTHVHNHAHAYKTFNLCRGLSRISHFSQGSNCEPFPSGMTHPKNLNKPPISLCVCVCLLVCVYMCVCNNRPRWAVCNPAGRRSVFQLASRAC